MRRTAIAAGLMLIIGLSAPLSWCLPITGTVVDDLSQAPLPNVSAEVLGYRPVSRISLQANENGVFQTGDLGPGEYTIVFGTKGYLDTTFSIRIRKEMPPQPALLIRMIRLGAIEGQLTELKGRSARVLALVRSTEAATETWKPVMDSILICCRAIPRRGAEVRTDGTFRIGDLPPGAYALLVSYVNPEGNDATLTTGLLRYPAGSSGFELSGDGASLRVQIPIPSGSGRAIEGQVRMPEGQPWYWVTLTNPDQPSLAVATTTSDEKGAFAFRGVVPGIYDLLAVPGSGERGQRRLDREVPWFGFGRIRVDIREQDSRGIAITPRDAISSSTTLQESNKPVFSPHCFIATVTLTTLEDWGVNLERNQELVHITEQGNPTAPETTGGLAPAKYGIGVRSASGCQVLNHPVLDISNTLTGSIEAQMTNPGVVRGHAGPTQEVILVPDHFTVGWSFLVANWFIASEGDFGVKSGFAVRGGQGDEFYVRIAAVDSEGKFEFTEVPAGRYRLVVRSADPAIKDEKREMRRIDVASAAVIEVDLTAP